MNRKNRVCRIIFPLGVCYGLVASDYSHELHQAMWATFLHYDKQYANAHDWYRTIIEQPTSVYSLKGYILFLFDRQQYASLTAYISIIQEQFKTDVDMQRIAAHTLAHIGKQAEADSLFIDLNKQFPTNADIAVETVKALLRATKLDDAIAVTHAIINKSTHNKHAVFMFFFLQAQLYMQKQDMPRARESVKECLSLRPQFMPGWLLNSMLEAQSGDLEKALQGYRSYIQLGGTQSKDFEQYLTHLAAQQQIKPGVPQSPLAYIQISPLTKIQMLCRSGSYNAALTMARACSEQNPTDVQYKLLTLHILTDMRKPEVALALVVSWAQKEPKEQLWFALIHLLADAFIARDVIIGTLESLQNKLPQTFWLHLYLADLYMRDKMYQEARVQFVLAVPHVPDTRAKTDIYFMLALVAYELGDYNAVHHAIQQGCALQIDHAPLYNIAAYYYATKGNNQTKAAEYIQKALVVDPLNLHYLDTQAVIWYKAHIYDKAELLLDKLHQQLPGDSTIALHAAKVKYKLGKTTDAYTLIQEARHTASHKHEYHSLAHIEQKWHIRS